MWTIAWRNLWRNRTRTFILGTAITVSYAIMLIFLGIGDDLHSRMNQAAERTAGGAILVHGKGYWEARSNDVILRNPRAVRSQIRNLDGVKSIIPRVYVHGLLHSPEGSNPIRLTGIDPERESNLRDFSRHLERGSFLPDNEERPLVLGSGLVDGLQLELGDRVVLTATGPEGRLRRELFYLTGVLKTGSRDLDESLALTNLGVARKALGLDGGITQFGLLLEEGQNTKKVTEAIRSSLGERMKRLEVLPWQTALPGLVGFIKADNAILYIYILLVFLIVAFSIINTFLMAVRERVRELGLLSALGFNNIQIVKVVLYETTFLAVVAMIAGLALGLLGHFTVDHYGIYMGAEMEVSGVALERVRIYSEIRPFKWGLFSMGVFVITIGGALYPAWRATRLAPAKAMNFYE